MEEKEEIKQEEIKQEEAAAPVSEPTFLDQSKKDDNKKEKTKRTIIYSAIIAVILIILLIVLLLMIKKCQPAREKEAGIEDAIAAAITTITDKYDTTELMYDQYKPELESLFNEYKGKINDAYTAEEVTSLIAEFEQKLAQVTAKDEALEPDFTAPNKDRSFNIKFGETAEALSADTPLTKDVQLKGELYDLFQDGIIGGTLSKTEAGLVANNEKVTFNISSAYEAQYFCIKFKKEPTNVTFKYYSGDEYTERVVTTVEERYGQWVIQTNFKFNNDDGEHPITIEGTFVIEDAYGRENQHGVEVTGKIQRLTGGYSWGGYIEKQPGDTNAKILKEMPVTAEIVIKSKDDGCNYVSALTSDQYKVTLYKNGVEVDLTAELEPIETEYNDKTFMVKVELLDDALPLSKREFTMYYAQVRVIEYSV